MKSRTLLGLSVVTALLSPLAARADGQSVLHDVRCVVLPGCSRVELRMAGAMRYSIEQHDRAIILNFAAASAGLSTNAASVGGRINVVERITVESLPEDIVRVKILLRGLAHYKTVEPDKGGLLYVDVYGDAPLPKTPPISRARIPVKKQEPSVQESRRTSIVDIAEIARSQVSTPEVGRAGQMPVITSPAATSLPATSGLQKLNGILFIAVLVAAAAVAVVGVLYIRMKRVNTARAARRVAVNAVRTESETKEQSPAVASGHQTSSQVSLDVRAEEPETPADPETHMLMFAERFQKSQGEFHLTYKLERETSARNPVGDLLNNGNRVETKSQRVKVAKKLGVGQGEVTLAANLKGLQGRTIRAANTSRKEAG